MKRQEELTKLHYAKELPYIGFKWNKETNDEYVAEKFATIQQAETWCFSGPDWRRVWTIKKGETLIVFAK